MKRCPECGTDYPDGAGYCPQDGVLLVEDVAGEKREDWRMIMPSLVRSEDATGDGSTKGDEPAGVSDPRTSEGDAAAVGGDAAVRASPGSRRRAGRQMSLGAFAQVPRHAPEPKKTLFATSAPQARPQDRPQDPTAAVGAASTAQGEGMVGRVLDQRYRIDGKIGEGSMGLVYRATHVIIDKPLAIKVLRSELALEPEVVQRFLQEAQLASRIKHPNVVEVSDYGQTGVGAAAYYVMECLRGRTLARMIATEGRLAPARSVDIAIQIAKGLAAAHAEGIVHRDLKPENVFLCIGPEGRELAKILDFGIARGLYASSSLTHQGMLIGTPAYMAPEQAESSDVDARADLYSLGVILFECLTGRALFADLDPMEAIHQRAVVTPADLRTSCPELPPLPTVERVLFLLLAVDRNDRPGDAQKTISLLEGALQEDLAEVSIGAPSSGRGRIDTAALGSGSASRSGPIVAQDEPAAVDDQAQTRVRGDRVAVTEGIKIRGREDADIIQPRTVSPSGRIQKRPSVIIKRGTPIERFVPPPPVSPQLPRSELSSDDLQRADEDRRGPPLGLIIGVAAVVAMAMTVTLWKYLIKDSKPADPVATPIVRTSKAEDYVRLRFESSPSGAEVLHSGESAIGQTPIDFQVPRGEGGILFVFRLPGHVDVAKTVTPNQTKTVRADLNPAPIGDGLAPASDPPKSSAGDEMAPEASDPPGLDQAAPAKSEKKPTGGKNSGGHKGAPTSATKDVDSKPETPGDKPPAEDPEPPAEDPEPMGDLNELKNPFAP